ncbi:hypothetical protein T4E_9154 [Trichinella pseudospiralis]|uniref:Uncharacterized protein n=1 Tax=Trichinella pseudospiralis TaxID=6337 RepID=A0A0V0YA72_TRIPS|nr:hypothetical protein T4E_9154 [Trichinella pseudospiralis]
MLGSNVGGEPGVNKLLVGAKLLLAGGEVLRLDDAGKLGERCTRRNADWRRSECWSCAGPGHHDADVDVVSKFHVRLSLHSNRTTNN